MNDGVYTAELLKKENEEPNRTLKIFKGNRGIRGIEDDGVPYDVDIDTFKKLRIIENKNTIMFNYPGEQSLHILLGKNDNMFKRSGLTNGEYKAYLIALNENPPGNRQLKITSGATTYTYYPNIDDFLQFKVN